MAVFPFPCVEVEVAVEVVVEVVVEVEVEVEDEDEPPGGQVVPVGVDADTAGEVVGEAAGEVVGEVAGEVVCEVAGEVLVVGEEPPQELRADRAPTASVISRILMASGLYAGMMSPTVLLRSAVWLASGDPVVWAEARSGS
jgi:hypothetical protein